MELIRTRLALPVAGQGLTLDVGGLDAGIWLGGGF
jgi:hypothetical protein